MLGRKCEFPRNLRTGPIPPRARGKNNDVRSLLTVCRGISEGRSGDGTQARRTVDSRDRDTRPGDTAGCRSGSPTRNSREGRQLVLKTQTEERASAFNTSGRGGLWRSLDSDSRCGTCLGAKTGTVIEYSLGSCRGRRKVAQVPPSRLGGERSNCQCGAERVDTYTIRACSHQKTELANWSTAPGGRAAALDATRKPICGVKFQPVGTGRPAKTSAADGYFYGSIFIDRTSPKDTAS